MGRQHITEVAPRPPLKKEGGGGGFWQKSTKVVVRKEDFKRWYEKGDSFREGVGDILV